MRHIDRGVSNRRAQTCRDGWSGTRRLSLARGRDEAWLFPVALSPVTTRQSRRPAALRAREVGPRRAIDVPAEVFKEAGEYRVRARWRDGTGRCGHWSAPLSVRVR